MSEVHPEIVGAPLTLWLAPVSTTMPLIDEAPGSFNASWVMVGTYGAEKDLERAKEALRRTMRPISDHRGSADYRLAIAQSLLDKFWWETGQPVAA